MQPIKRNRRLTEEACAQMRTAILSGELAGLMPGELELCRQLQISRVTLRQALGQMEREGLVTGGQGRRRQVVASEKTIPPDEVRPGRVAILSSLPMTVLTASKLLWMDELKELLAGQGVILEFINRAVSVQKQPDRMLSEITRQYPHTVWLLLRSTAPMQRWFVDQRIPAVVAGSIFEGVRLPFVDMEYFAACRHAAGRLLARGCRKLGLLLPQPMLAGDRESEAGFRDGAGDASVAVIGHDGTVSGLCRVLDETMRSHPPQGMLAFHATHAATALTRLTSSGWQLPRDLKLISRDDDPFLANLTPQLARYSATPRAYATALAKIIFNLLSGSGTAPVSERILPEFLSGETI